MRNLILFCAREQKLAQVLAGAGARHTSAQTRAYGAHQYQHKLIWAAAESIRLPAARMSSVCSGGI